MGTASPSWLLGWHTLQGEHVPMYTHACQLHPQPMWQELAVGMGQLFTQGDANEQDKLSGSGDTGTEQAQGPQEGNPSMTLTRGVAEGGGVPPADTWVPAGLAWLVHLHPVRTTGSPPGITGVLGTSRRSLLASPYPFAWGKSCLGRRAFQASSLGGTLFFRSSPSALIPARSSEWTWACSELLGDLRLH